MCAQAGEVNTGAFDPLGPIADAVAERPGTWLHVDGAFGLWAAVAPGLRSRLDGHDRADSWTTDAHKWLNVPYDSGLVFVRDVAAHRAAMGVAAAYLPAAGGVGARPLRLRAGAEPPRPRLRGLRRDPLARPVRDRRAGRAHLRGRRAGWPTGLAAAPGVDVLNEVVLNQVLVRFDDDDALTRDVIARVQDDGTAWLGGTTFHGRVAMRISVSNWATTADDGDRTVDAILRCLDAARAART